MLSQSLGPECDYDEDGDGADEYGSLSRGWDFVTRIVFTATQEFRSKYLNPI